MTSFLSKWGAEVNRFIIRMPVVRHGGGPAEWSHRISPLNSATITARLLVKVVAAFKTSSSSSMKTDCFYDLSFVEDWLSCPVFKDNKDGRLFFTMRTYFVLCLNYLIYTRNSCVKSNNRDW